MEGEGRGENQIEHRIFASCSRLLLQLQRQGRLSSPYIRYIHPLEGDRDGLLPAACLRTEAALFSALLFPPPSSSASFNSSPGNANGMSLSASSSSPFASLSCVTYLCRLILTLLKSINISSFEQRSNLFSSNHASCTFNPEIELSFLFSSCSCK